MMSSIGRTHDLMNDKLVGHRVLIKKYITNMCVNTVHRSYSTVPMGYVVMNSYFTSSGDTEGIN